MTRLLGIIILMAGLFFFWNQGSLTLWKQKIIEAVNPALKEKRLIGELENNLGKLQNLFGQNKKLIGSETEEKEASRLLRQAQEALVELKETNAKLDLGANVSNLIQKLTPFDLAPVPTWVPPTACENPSFSSPISD